VSDPARTAVTADLASARFRSGVTRKQWRVISHEHPSLIVGEPDGTASEYAFRFDLTGFPGTAPEVLIWDATVNAHLSANRRPKGSARVVEAFKDWTVPHPVYRPWERTSSTHNNFAQTFPELAWHPKRDLAFIMEDLHGLLSSNAARRGTG
jgi:hypothetical protein